MALIKCTECGQDISTEAPVCPHCGKPNIAATPKTEQPTPPKKGALRSIIAFVIIVLAVLFSYLLIRASSSYSGHGTFIGNLTQDLNRGNFEKVFNDILSGGQNNMISPTSNRPNSGTRVALQEVNNLGYTFSLGEIESAGTTNINDDLKNTITKVAYDTKFPKNILRETPIVIVNNLALKDDMYISTPNGNLRIPKLDGHFLSVGGLYASSPSNAVIFINKSALTGGSVRDVLAHEFGHAVGSKLTDQEWTRFYQLRSIPTGTARQGTNWNLSPQEDFAEVYKNVFTGGGVRTYYGQLVPSLGGVDTGIDMGSCMKVYMDAQSRHTPRPETDPNDPSSWLKALTNPQKIDYAAVSAEANADSQVQACRRGVMINPSAHSSDWSYGAPYRSVVGPATRSFINEIVNRLNQ